MLSYLFDATAQNPWLPISGLFFFIILFIVSIIWAIRRDKAYIHKMSSLPIESNNQNREKNDD
jgi:flagellar biogenesis protein FliO